MLFNKLISTASLVAMSLCLLATSTTHAVSMLSIEDSGFEIQGANALDNIDENTTPWHTRTGGGGAENQVGSVEIRTVGDTGLNTVPAGVGGTHALRLGFKFDAVSVRNQTQHLIDASRTYTLEGRAAASDTHAGPFSSNFQLILNADNGTANGANVGVQTFVATEGFQTFSFNITPADLAGSDGEQIQIRLFKGANTNDFVWIDDVKLYASAPTDVSGDQTQSVAGIEVIQEQTITLASDLAVSKINVAGTTVGPSASIDNVFIDAGTTVTSHLVHFDPDATSGGVTANGVFSFDDPIVGLIYGDALLSGTDDLLGLANVIYASDIGASVTAFRSALNEGTDNAIISADGRTIDITLLVGTGAAGAVDQFRILTAAPPVPEPTTGLLALIGTASLAARRRRVA